MPKPKLPLHIRKHTERARLPEPGWPHRISGTACVVYLPRSILNKAQAATWSNHYAVEGSLIEFLGHQWQVSSPAIRRLILKAECPATDQVTVIDQYPEYIHRVEYETGTLLPVGDLPWSWLVDIASCAVIVEEEEVE